MLVDVARVLLIPGTIMIVREIVREIVRQIVRMTPTTVTMNITMNITINITINPRSLHINAILPNSNNTVHHAEAVVLVVVVHWAIQKFRQEQRILNVQPFVGVVYSVTLEWFARILYRFVQWK